MRIWTVLALAVIAAAVGTATAAEKPYRHCYYLFAVRGESEYLPLLVTREDLSAGEPVKAALVMTYERDSIWEISRDPVEVKPPYPRAILARQLEMRRQIYRYQEIPREEALRLLKNPEGKLPVSRIRAPITREVKPLRDELRRDLAAAAS